MSKLVRIAPGLVAEMSNSFDGGDIDVPLAHGVDLEDLTRNDEDPLFVTIDALSDTISNNKRRWTPDELRRVAEQVMSKKPDGYQGHLKPEDRSSKAPDAVTLWLGAKVVSHAGRDRLFIKGYILPKAPKFRDYVRRAKAAGKNIAVSVYGQAMEKWNETLGAYEISNFNLESIDWARPGSEGVPNSGFLKLTTEMDEGDKMDKIDILKSTTVSEMQEHNPAVVQEIETQAQVELQSVVSEMTTTLGLEDSSKLVETVAEMKTQHDDLQTQVAHSEIDKILGNKVSNIAARRTLKKMVISEMSSNDLAVVQETVGKVLESEEGKALTEAFKTNVVPIATEDNRHQRSGRRFIKK